MQQALSKGVRSQARAHEARKEEEKVHWGPLAPPPPPPPPPPPVPISQRETVVEYFARGRLLTSNTPIDFVAAKRLSGATAAAAARRFTDGAPPEGQTT